MDARGRIALRWSVEVTGGEVIAYISVFESDGTMLMTYNAFPSVFWLDEDRLIGTAAYDLDGAPAYQSPDIPYGWIPSIIDLRDGSIRPILDPFGGDSSNRNWVVGVQRG